MAHETVRAICARYGLLGVARVSKSFKAEFGESSTLHRARVLGGEDEERFLFQRLQFCPGP